MVGYFDEAENKAIVCGGNDVNNEEMNSCFEYSLETGQWNEAQYRMLARRFLAASVVLNNGSFFVSGGSDSFETSEFPIEGKLGPRLPYDAYQHCLCQINKTHLFMAGGSLGARARQAYILNLNTAEWTQLPDMIEFRYSHLCHSIMGGKEIIVIGGRDKSSVESFDSINWRVVNPFPSEISYARYVDYKETFLIVGGYDGAWADFDTIYEFVPSNYSLVERSEKLVMGRDQHLSLALKSGWREKANICE